MSLQVVLRVDADAGPDVDSGGSDVLLLGDGKGPVSSVSLKDMLLVLRSLVLLSIPDRGAVATMVSSSDPDEKIARFSWPGAVDVVFVVVAYDRQEELVTSRLGMIQLLSLEMEMLLYVCDAQESTQGTCTYHFD